MEWTAAQIAALVALVGAVAGGIGTVMGVFFTKGIDAWVKARKVTMEEQKQGDDGLVGGYKVAIDQLRASSAETIGQLTSRITSLEKEQREDRQHHLECIREQERLRGELAGQKAQFEKDVQSLQEEVRTLREWRHQLANQEHLKALEVDIATAAAKQLEGKSG